MNETLQKSLGEYAAQGFRLSEESDHVLVLYYKAPNIAAAKEEEVLRVNQNAPFVTRKFLQNECATFLKLAQPGGNL